MFVCFNPLVPKYKYNKACTSITISFKALSDPKLLLTTAWTDTPDLNLKLNVTGTTFFLSYFILIPREPLLNILIVQTAGTVLFLPVTSLNHTVPDLTLNWTVTISKFYFTDLIVILNLKTTGAALHLSVLILISQISGAAVLIPSLTLFLFILSIYSSGTPLLSLI